MYHNQEYGIILLSSDFFDLPGSPFILIWWYLSIHSFVVSHMMHHPWDVHKVLSYIIWFVYLSMRDALHRLYLPNITIQHPTLYDDIPVFVTYQGSILGLVISGLYLALFERWFFNAHTRRLWNGLSAYPKLQTHSTTFWYVWYNAAMYYHLQRGSLSHTADTCSMPIKIHAVAGWVYDPPIRRI